MSENNTMWGFMDEDGYGMTDEEEIEIYGFIVQNARVVFKFKNINENYRELNKMHKKQRIL